ncbi:hypothetical protein C9426_17830 [Serratia sp. S1B]|nr:hypothetical protein C9426_17830 [Serratia sp. S1B]
MTGGEPNTSEADFNCLAAPQLKGLKALQANLVDRIKRAAIARLHRSSGGERMLLRMYLIGEDATERTLMDELMPQSPPWLERVVAQHLADEQRHVKLFAEALQAMGEKNTTELKPDWLSRQKIRYWQRLAHQYAAHFQYGLLVPAYATGLCAEQMAERVLSRHCAVIGVEHSRYPLLSSVLADEKAHVRVCKTTLRRIVTPDELPQLARLLKEIRRVESSFGITGALVMYVASWVVGGWRHSGSHAP